MQPSSTTPKFFDVARPSQINPNSTSRPIIVGHRPMMVDPMMRGVRDPNPPLPKPAPPEHVAKVIKISEEMKQSLSEPELYQPPASSTLDPAVATTLGEASPAQTAALNFTPGSASAEIAEQSAQSLGSVTPPAAIAASIPPPLAMHPVSEPELSHLQHIPVSHMPVTSSKRIKSLLLWSFVVMFLGAFSGYLAIDAGLINSSIDLPFHIFSRQT